MCGLPAHIYGVSRFQLALGQPALESKQDSPSHVTTCMLPVTALFGSHFPGCSMFRLLTTNIPGQLTAPLRILPYCTAHDHCKGGSRVVSFLSHSMANHVSYV